MAEYIKREDALRWTAFVHGRWDDTYLSATQLRGIPAADVVPVVHGQWINPQWKNDMFCYNCSNCRGEAMHREYRWSDKKIYPICPNCGARMYGGVDNEPEYLVLGW